MRQYEAIYIIQPNLVEEDRKTLNEDISSIFTEVTKVTDWGMRELAYEIEDHSNGYYTILEVNATNEEVLEFERVCRIKEDVIRFMITSREV